MIRWVICMDVEADSLEEAYERVYDAMATITDGKTLDWESTDEAYAPDGSAISETALQAARMQVFARKHPEEIE